MTKQFGVLLFSFALCGVANAGTISPSCPGKPEGAAEQKELAKVWFSKGETLVREQMYAEAVGAFGCSLLMVEHPATLYNKAKAARESGQREEELETLERYLQLQSEGEKADEARLRVAELEVELGGDPAEAQEPETATETRTSRPQVITENPFTESSSEPEKSPLTAAGVAGIAVGSGVLVAGIVLAGLSAKARDDGESTDNYNSYVSNQERMESTQTASIITLSVGAAVLASGIAMYVIGKKKEDPEKSAAVFFLPTGMIFRGRF